MHLFNMENGLLASRNSVRGTVRWDCPEPSRSAVCELVRSKNRFLRNVSFGFQSMTIGEGPRVLLCSKCVRSIRGLELILNDKMIALFSSEKLFRKCGSCVCSCFHVCVRCVCLGLCEFKCITVNESLIKSFDFRLLAGLIKPIKSLKKNGKSASYPPHHDHPFHHRLCTATAVGSLSNSFNNSLDNGLFCCFELLIH